MSSRAHLVHLLDVPSYTQHISSCFLSNRTARLTSPSSDVEPHEALGWVVATLLLQVRRGELEHRRAAAKEL